MKFFGELYYAAILVILAADFILLFPLAAMVVKHCEWNLLIKLD